MSDKSINDITGMDVSDKDCVELCTISLGEGRSDFHNKVIDLLVLLLGELLHALLLPAIHTNTPRTG